VLVVDLDLVERMKLPGAVMSGFIRPSSVGPRLENPASPSEVSAILSVEIGAAGNDDGHHPPHSDVIVGRSFSPAATVMTFFPVAGEPSESSSISPSEFPSTPLLPAEKRIVMFWYVRALESACIEPEVYTPATLDPHELV
jgi:hypothetical protein